MGQLYNCAGWQSCTDPKSYTKALVHWRNYDFDLSTPFCDFKSEVQDIIIHGTNGYGKKVYYKEGDWRGCL